MYVWSNRSLSLLSLIDFLAHLFLMTLKIRSVFTDHKRILIKIYAAIVFSENNTSSYWKLNNSLLNILN